MEGDGIGPEIIDSSLDVINLVKKKLNLKIKLIHLKIGLASLKSQGTTFPDNCLNVCKNSDGIILGPVDHNNYPEEINGGFNPSSLLEQN